MYGGKTRNGGYMERLNAFLRTEYGIDAIAISPAKRGFFGETWRAQGANAEYFVKIVYAKAHRPVYARSFAVLNRIRESGVREVPMIYRTAGGLLYTEFDGAAAGVFEWVEGENRQDATTKPAEYSILAKVYGVNADGLDIRRDDLSSARAEVFYRMWEELKGDKTESAARVLDVLDSKRDVLLHRRRRLESFAKLCGADNSHFYITHGDAGGNIIVNGNGFTIIDWDDPRLAPPERDAWFCMHIPGMMDMFAGSLSQEGIAYAPRPERLAYYCYHSFFHYLTEYLSTYFDIQNDDMDERLNDFFSCWIEEELSFAETL